MCKEYSVVGLLTALPIVGSAHDLLSNRGGRGRKRETERVGVRSVRCTAVPELHSNLHFHVFFRAPVEGMCRQDNTWAHLREHVPHHRWIYQQMPTPLSPPLPFPAPRRHVRSSVRVCVWERRARAACERIVLFGCSFRKSDNNSLF